MGGPINFGNLYGTVVYNEGEPLPGVTVTLTGDSPPQVQVTDADGNFRFIGLPAGTYQALAELEGFSSVRYPNISIAAGHDTQIEITIQLSIE